MQPSWIPRLGLVALTAVGVSVGASAQTAPSARGGGVAQDARARFAGPAFRFVGGSAEREALRDGIARAVAPMNFIARPVARGRLTDRNPVYASVAFRFPGDAIEVDMAGRPPLRSPAGGTTVQTRAITGEAVRLSQWFQGPSLIQTITSREGERRNEFTVSPNGRLMTMHVTLRARQLPEPLHYRLSYAR